MNFKKWVKSIQTAGYNGAGTVYEAFKGSVHNHRHGGRSKKLGGPVVLEKVLLLLGLKNVAI